RPPAVAAGGGPGLETNPAEHADLAGGLIVKMLQVLRDSPGQFPVVADHAILGAGDDQVEELGHERKVVGEVRKTRRLAGGLDVATSVSEWTNGEIHSLTLVVQECNGRRIHSLTLVATSDHLKARTSTIHSLALAARPGRLAFFSCLSRFSWFSPLMTIGVPKEIKIGETRVSMTPSLCR